MTFRAREFDDTNGELILRNNMICNSKDRNTSEHGQGATLVIYKVNKSFITNNTIAHNDSAQSSTFIVDTTNASNLPDRQVDIFNNILHGNNNNLYQLKLIGGGFPPPLYLKAEVAYNSIEGLWYAIGVDLWSTENDQRNPYFIDVNDNNFHIQFGFNSCVDVGILPTDPGPFVTYPFADAYMTYSDIELDRRPLNGDPLLPVNFDIGADEYKL